MYVLVYFLCFSYVTHHENIFYVVTRTTMLPSGLYYLFLLSLFLISAFSSELRLPEHIFCGDYLILTFLFICFYGGKKNQDFVFLLLLEFLEQIITIHNQLLALASVSILEQPYLSTVPGFEKGFRFYFSWWVHFVS